MNAFVNAIKHQETTTTNGMKAFVSSSDSVVDLFYKISASRGKCIIPDFVAAFTENKELALRVALWARDIRGGAGEREIFRNILNYLAESDTVSATRLMDKVPTVGRYDDLLAVESDELLSYGFEILANALKKAQMAKKILSNIDDMTEEECKIYLEKNF